MQDSYFAYLYTLRLRQNGHHFANDIFKCIFLNENFWILNSISLKYIPYGLIDNLAALVQIMAWHQIGNKPLSETMLVCFTDTYMLLRVTTTVVITWLSRLSSYFRDKINPMSQYKAVVSLLLMHWGYISLALSHGQDPWHIPTLDQVSRFNYIRYPAITAANETPAYPDWVWSHFQTFQDLQTKFNMPITYFKSSSFIIKHLIQKTMPFCVCSLLCA